MTDGIYVGSDFVIACKWLLFNNSYHQLVLEPPALYNVEDSVGSNASKLHMLVETNTIRVRKTVENLNE